MVVAIEWLCAAKALVRLDQDPGIDSGEGTRAALTSVERVLVDGGLVPSDDMMALSDALGDGRLMVTGFDCCGHLERGG